jgi:SNF2 family DNA or RNA helicase
MYRHQVTAVAMMLERESSDIESCRFPSIWERTKSTDVSKRLGKSWTSNAIHAQVNRYRNTVTGVYSEFPARAPGGLLADVCFINRLDPLRNRDTNSDQDMGLGKTLSTIALICSSLDHDSSTEDASLPTLVVTPKSSKSSQ